MPRFEDFDFSKDGTVSFAEWQRYLDIQRQEEEAAAAAAAAAASAKSSANSYSYVSALL
jgi:hypothetical protein